MSSKHLSDVPQDRLAWYVIRVYPGYEHEVMERILERLQIQPVHNPGMQILAPVETLVEENDKKQYLGYLAVKMRMRTEVWAVIMNTPGVTGYIGIGVRPTRFSHKDWKDIPFHQFRS